MPEPRCCPTAYITRAAATSPRSEISTRFASSDRNREPHGAKWLFPSGTLEGVFGRLLGAAVMLNMRYA